MSPITNDPTTDTVNRTDDIDSFCVRRLGHKKWKLTLNVFTVNGKRTYREFIADSPQNAVSRMFEAVREMN